MRILYVLQRLAHPSVRGELRHYHFLVRLAQAHEITLVSLDEGDDSTRAVDELARVTRRVIVVPGPRRAAAVANDGGLARARALARRVEKARQFRRSRVELTRVIDGLIRTGGFDVLLFAGSDLHAAIARETRIPIVVDWCDASSLRLRGSMRYAAALERPWRCVRYWQAKEEEARLGRAFRHVTFISRRDHDAVRGAVPGGAVIPNGCDLEYWRRRERRETRRLIFTGVMDYPPNTDAARQLVERVAPRVRAHVPDLEVVIAGHNPPPDLVRAAAATSGVTVTGSVPDLRPYLDEAAVFVAPLRFASGMQNKILEAMAMELPVVTTPVAAAGLEIEDDEPVPVVVADTPDRLAEATITLLRQPPRAQALGRAGRAFVTHHCNWDRGARLLERMCRDAVEAGRVPVAPSPLDTVMSRAARSKPGVRLFV